MEAAPLRELHGCAPHQLPMDTLLAGAEPVVLRGVVHDWPLVGAGRRGSTEAMAVLRQHDAGRALQYSWGAPDIAGRAFYTPDLSALNFEVRAGTLDGLLREIAAHLEEPRPPMYYLASLPVDEALPGLRAGNDLALGEAGIAARASIWIGNRVVASCHYDALDNIACCAVGLRRFTLFPPDQVGNLYPGPLERNPGGQAISLVDFNAPDLARYPRFADARAQARSALLEPGDAIFIPALWWHHVESLAPFNVLVNYWWSSAPAHLAPPMQALYHALWALRDRPDVEKAGWRALFDYYVFGPAERAGAHLPEAARGVLGTLDPAQARQLRAMLMSRLNR